MFHESASQHSDMGCAAPPLFLSLRGLLSATLMDGPHLHLYWNLHPVLKKWWDSSYLCQEWTANRSIETQLEIAVTAACYSFWLWCTATLLCNSADAVLRDCSVRCSFKHKSDDLDPSWSSVTLERFLNTPEAGVEMISSSAREVSVCGTFLTRTE